jgi:UbiD family decarboxylase
MGRLKSLREYVDAKAISELQEIDQEVDWNLEIGAISRRCYETGSPAPLFNTIKGIEKGFCGLVSGNLLFDCNITHAGNSQLDFCKVERSSFKSNIPLLTLT